MRELEAKSYKDSERNGLIVTGHLRLTGLVADVGREVYFEITAR